MRRELRQNLIWQDRGAGGCQIGCGIASALRVMGTVDANSNDDVLPLAFDQNSGELGAGMKQIVRDRKSTRLNSSHANISYAVFCLKKKKNNYSQTYSSRSY